LADPGNREHQPQKHVDQSQLLLPGSKPPTHRTGHIKFDGLPTCCRTKYAGACSQCLTSIDSYKYVMWFWFATAAVPCGANEFTCANSQCIQESYICDAEDDCGDNSDEQNCHGKYFILFLVNTCAPGLCFSYASIVFWTSDTWHPNVCLMAGLMGVLSQWWANHKSNHKSKSQIIGKNDLNENLKSKIKSQIIKSNQNHFRSKSNQITNQFHHNVNFLKMFSLHNNYRISQS